MTSLSKNVKFSIEKNTDAGSFVVRSKTESFNLEHIVDKDIVSFYGELSKYGILDTGILPLSGTGVLAIRSAGHHTQITFQHAPQVNYINWGAHEGDRNAKTYLVAQPYRIWIGDTIDGNLFGARMFYSPYPITSANQPLYHLNLPNTNCKGYRGNGVGWQCLYHKDDWTNLPLNEKIVRFAERCSGVETFNDNNMSETDGPRFYAAHYGEDSDYEYLWNPTAWQQKTEKEGLDWVLDENIWIPVLVKNLDNQERHYEGGEPLTLGMALTGDYQAYYSDNYRPKPINALTRSDLSQKITAETVASWVMRSHNSANVAYVPINSIEKSEQHRQHVVLNSPKVKVQQEQEDEEESENSINLICPISGNPCSTHEDDVLVDSLDNAYCSGCYEENTTYCENSDSTLPSDSEYVYYHSPSGEYYDTRAINFVVCPNCESFQYVDLHHQITDVVIFDKNELPVCCISCSKDYFYEHTPDHFGQCSHCSTSVAANHQNGVHPDWDHVFTSKTNVYLSGEDKIIEQNEVYCSKCISSSAQCPTGHLTWLPLTALPVPIDLIRLEQKIQITHLCASCANPEIWQNGKLTEEQIKTLTSKFSVVTQAEERFAYSFDNGLISGSPFVKNLGLASSDALGIDAVISAKSKETDDELSF